MKKIRYYFFGLCMGLCILWGSLSLAQDHQASSGAVEIIIRGKHYKSIRAYKHAQIKGILRRALSSYHLKEFSEDELCEIIKEIRKQHTADHSFKKELQSTHRQDGELLCGQQTLKEEAHDVRTSQMRDMLEHYLEEHDDIKRCLIDPDKVKNIMISPQERPEELLKE